LKEKKFSVLISEREKREKFFYYSAPKLTKFKKHDIGCH